MILSTVIDDQGILQSNWTKGATGHTQPKLVIQLLPSIDDNSIKKLGYHLILQNHKKTLLHTIFWVQKRQNCLKVLAKAKTSYIFPLTEFL